MLGSMTPQPRPDSDGAEIERHHEDVHHDIGAAPDGNPALRPRFLADPRFRVAEGVYFLPGFRINS